MEKVRNQETITYSDFKKGYHYLQTNGYIDERERALDFYYGKQWAKATKNNKNIPRAVFNICKLQIVNKQSNIVSVPVAIRFFTNNSFQDTKFVTNFAKYLFKEMNHDRHRNKSAFDALVKGTAVQHMYYDQYKFGTYGDYEGGICEEILDFSRVAVANPFNKDVQAQKWVIIQSTRSVDAVKKLIKGNVTKEKLLAEELEEINKSKETPQEDVNTINVYLRYYRKNGEVYHSLSTKSVVIYKDKPLNPNLIKVSKVKNEKQDEEWIQLPDDTLTTNNIDEYSKIKFYRYPVHFLTFNESDESIYGKSELNDVIPTQRYINQLWSMQLLNVMNMAWDKYVVMPNALRNQIINDQSGQVLVDYSGTGNGIKRLGGMSAMANGVVELSAQAFNLHRTVHQITDLYTGQTEQKDIAASALSQLNNQADKPIDVLRQKLWNYEEEIGKTLDLFIKLYFTEQKFSYELSEAEMIAQGNNTNKYVEQTFDGNKFKDVQFHIVVEAVQGTKNSELVQENLAQSLFLNNTWANMSSHDKEAYIEMSPLAAPLKEQLRALMEKQKQDEIAAYQAQIQQLTQQNEMLVGVANRAKAGIDYLTSLNRSMEKSYRDEVKAHQDDVKVRDEAVAEIMNKEPDGKPLKKQ